MANAVENALNRANTEQREKALQVIEEARHNIKLVSMRDNVTPLEAESVAKNAQIIEDAKRTIPAETMKEVDSVSPPLPTPPMHGNVNATSIELNPTMQSQIESIEQGQGNNYLQENAVDRAMQRQGQEVQRDTAQGMER